MSPSVAQLNNTLVHLDGSEIVPANPPPNFFVQTLGSVDGTGLAQDRITITRTHGRSAAGRRDGDVGIDRDTFHINIGDVLHMAFYTNAQEAAPGPSGDEWRPKAYRRIDIKVVGFGLLNSAIVQDDIDAAASNFALFTPALTRPLVECCASSTQTGLVLEHGARDVPRWNRN